MQSFMEHEKPYFTAVRFTDMQCPYCKDPLGKLMQLAGSPELPYHPEMMRQILKSEKNIKRGRIKQFNTSFVNEYFS